MAGRPKKKISKKTFEELCSIQCTQTEIIQVLGVSDKTLNNWCRATYGGLNFSEVFGQKRGKGKASLRRSQWQLAKSNPTMAIWLGKQYLGQKDEKQLQVSGDVNCNNPFDGVTTDELVKMREKLINDD